MLYTLKFEILNLKYSLVGFIVAPVLLADLVQ